MRRRNYQFQAEDNRTIMAMNQRNRILSTYRGATPDVVPFMLDLSHWYYHKHRQPWDLSIPHEKPEHELIEYHKKAGVGFYIVNMSSFYSVAYPEDVVMKTEKRIREGRPEIWWRIQTPLGTIERCRSWEDTTYAWAIRKWGIATEQDLRVFAYAMSRASYSPSWDRYKAWVDSVGDIGVVYMPAGYSCMGHLLHYWMGVERTVYATIDMPDVMQEVVEACNENLLRLIDLLGTSPAEIVFMGDNFSGDVQPPSFFAKWARPYYEEAIRRLHRAGKQVAVHIDGRLRGAISMIRDAGADCADAVTPLPMGDLSPEEARKEAGPDFILSGGVSPDLWLPGVPLEVFKAKVIEWLDLRRYSPRLIAAAGDQVPPGADESRIEVMRSLVEERGRY
jgi:hypothetical protein